MSSIQPNYVKALLTPSAAGTLLYTIGSIALLLLSNLTGTFGQIVTPSLQYYSSQIGEGYSTTLNALPGLTSHGGAITVFLLWAGIGALVYIIVWLAANQFLTFQNEVIIGSMYTGFRRPNRVMYWMNLGLRGLLRASAIIMAILVAFVAVEYWHPLADALFGAWLTNSHIPINWAYLLASFVGWLLIFHMFVVFLRLSLLRTRIIPEAVS